MVRYPKHRGALGLGVILAAACGAPEDAPRVQLRENVEDLLLLTGEVRSARSIDLSTPQMPGFQARIHYLAADGSQVKAGDVVVGFDVGAWVSQLDEKRLGLVRAETALLNLEQAGPPEQAQHQAALERAGVEARKARLEADVPAEVQSRQEWQQKQNALRRAQAELAKAELQLETWQRTRQAELEKARIEVRKAERALALVRDGIRRTELRAPEDGLVLVQPNWNQQGRPLQAGDAVWPGLNVVSLPILANLEVQALLPELDLGRVRAGQRVRCVPDAFPERVLEGTVRSVGEAAVTEWGRSGYPVYVALDERPDWLRHGMSVRAAVVRQRWERALSVPRAAVEWRGEASSVRLNDGRRVPVELEECLATECLVASGLEEGTHVALP
jgi:multidrug resistance efflux pump